MGAKDRFDLSLADVSMLGKNSQEENKQSIH